MDNEEPYRLKLGDRVRVVCNCEDGGDNWAIGRTGVIDDFDTTDDYVEVRLDDDSGSPYTGLDNPKGTYLFGLYQLEIIA